MVRDLHELNAIVLNEAGFTLGHGPEFYVSLSASGEGCALGRIELARAMMAELRCIPD